MAGRHTHLGDATWCIHNVIIEEATMLNESAPVQIEDPPLARALFGNTRWSWVWLIVRVYVGFNWLKEGLAKAGDPTWVGAQAGQFMTVWITRALPKTQGAHPDVQGWYGSFLAHIVLPQAAIWSYAITFGEIAVGIGLILGLFTGIAAFFGTTMNASYLLAGTVSTNPILFALGSLLVLAWKTAGWWGADRWLLPALGTPWRHVAASEETRTGAAIKPPAAGAGA
jgi:thiosulfate dehydrogenase [quinone] large subunit